MPKVGKKLKGVRENTSEKKEKQDWEPVFFSVPVKPFREKGFVQKQVVKLNRMGIEKKDGKERNESNFLCKRKFVRR